MTLNKEKTDTLCLLWFMVNVIHKLQQPTNILFKKRFVKLYCIINILDV